MNEYSSMSQQTPHPYAPSAQSTGREFAPATDARTESDDQRAMGYAMLSAKLVGMRHALEIASEHILGEEWHDEQDESVEYGLSPLCLPHYRNQIGSSIEGSESTPS
jgi:hypothetical protein